MHLRKLILPVLFLGLILCSSPKASAGEIDILVDKLVEKGILTRADAREVLSETRAEVKRQADAMSYTGGVPEWVQKTKFKGDFRLRHEYKRKHDDNEALSRGRIRFRLGIESRINDQVKVGAGLATGGDSVTSTNQDLQDFFATPSIDLDYAFAEYSPTDWAKVVGGKFKRKPYLWTPTDMLWDSDINPEGGSLHLTHKLTDNIKGFFNTGVWVLDDDGATDEPDPYLQYTQGGMKWKNGDYDARVAGIYYGFHGIQGINPPETKGTNTKISTGDTSFKYDYDSAGASAEFGITEPLGAPLERVAVFGDYIHNISDNVELDTGWAFGVKLGDKKVKEKGSWQGKYMYVNLGKDAFLDVFPDGDRESGGTDVRSHEVILQYGLAKNIMYEIDYYNNKKIKATENAEQVVQNSVIFKF